MNWKTLIAALAAVLFNTAVQAAEIKLAVTTSFHNSGLSDVLLPQIKADLNLDVLLIVVGTGQALKLGQAGDVDAILVHSRQAEDTFLAAGFGTHRREIMYNDFVLIGPKSDPAKISTADTAATALRRIAHSGTSFVSRGDDSGTHKKELSLWVASGIPIESLEVHGMLGKSSYHSVGAGMGAALNTANGLNAYIMADRASWLNFGNKGDLALLFAGDPVLFNQYAFIPVNPGRHPHVRVNLVLMLEEWLVSESAADLINNHKINGEVLFTFNAQPK